jgi:hypothetical protein
LTANDLAALLKPYGVTSKNVREGDVVKKGYHRDQLVDAWSRYLVTPVTPPGEEGTDPSDPSDVLSIGGVTGVTGNGVGGAAS